MAKPLDHGPCFDVVRRLLQENARLREAIERATRSGGNGWALAEDIVATCDGLEELQDALKERGVIMDAASADAVELWLHSVVPPLCYGQPCPLHGEEDSDVR